VGLGLCLEAHWPATPREEDRAPRGEIVRWQPTLDWAAAGMPFVMALTQMPTRRGFVYFQF